MSFYSSHYLHCTKSYCENISEFVCVISEKKLKKKFTIEHAVVSFSPWLFRTTVKSKVTFLGYSESKWSLADSSVACLIRSHTRFSLLSRIREKTMSRKFHDLYKIGSPKSFVKLKKKIPVLESLFNSKKGSPAQVFSCKFCKKNYRTPPDDFFCSSEVFKTRLTW